MKTEFKKNNFAFSEKTVTFIKSSFCLGETTAPPPIKPSEHFPGRKETDAPDEKHIQHRKHGGLMTREITLCRPLQKTLQKLYERKENKCAF